MINAYILIKPVVSEKSLKLAQEKNVYTFVVSPLATKPQIAQTIKELYDVEVIRVRTVMKQVRARKTGRKRLSSPTTKSKKALITLKADQKLDIFDVK